MGVIARRLQDSEEDWRHVYKSLLLLEFMSKHGPQKVFFRPFCLQLCSTRIVPPGLPLTQPRLASSSLNSILVDCLTLLGC